MKIIWNGYIKDQLDWAKKLGDIAVESENGTADRYRAHAMRAISNARGAVVLQISGVQQTTELR